MLTGLKEVWELDNFFPGGSKSEQLHKFLEELQKDMDARVSEVQAWDIPQAGNESKELVTLLENMQQTIKKAREVSAFVSCLTAQDVSDKEANLLRGRLTQMNAGFQMASSTLEEKISKIADSTWKVLLQDEKLAELAFVLEERRSKAKEKLPLEQESLINDLSVDGYHAWGQLYNTLVGRMTIPFEENGETKQLSVGQAQNKLYDHDRNVRQVAFANWEKAWEEQEDLFSETLNRLGGYRLNVYKHRGWDKVLKEPLEVNRMSEDTLATMWNVINDNKTTYVNYLNRKAEMLGVDKLGWTDIYAPVGSVDNKMSYDEGANFIVKHFESFSPKMADFAKTAFTENWIEAEDRAGKRPGGFCTSFPLAKESRIFMTYDGSANSVSTLAHELGHAYHSHVINDLDEYNTHYAMNVAETASTFAEMIVSDAALKSVDSKEEKLALLDDNIQRSIAFFMDIQSRFLFETRFYEERKNGLVSTNRLNELMVEAQKEAFNESLNEYHPHFWSSKLHFYITGVPFYNFPYTFGYLFSMGIYALALKEGKSFEDNYINLLRDTARMSVEDLAMKHLNVDLTKPDFWQGALDVANEYVAQFMELTDK
ncbi:oligoendopeptidase [Lottiidibacillus patelloidae]|uniref:Oligoendopeptidase n=1 Tax=Lottiidibacillus patelloidae TaxID=2670334 RepID=A0A263BWU0_9BACI|nr:M3 family oligoendopeptidase [Lottiidibacillus patelloidae]OZM57787.1 oligoendopeptidase [Lottiidibacillus patelloidae]